MLPYVLVTVMSVLVQIWHIAVQQVMLFAQIQLPHVTVQEAVQCLIVRHALTLMVYVDIQHVVVILAVKHMIMGLLALPVTLVAVALVLCMSQLDPLASIAQLHTIGVMAPGIAHALADHLFFARPALIQKRVLLSAVMTDQTVGV